jgi:hypothetical protein
MVSVETIPGMEGGRERENCFSIITYSYIILYSHCSALTYMCVYVDFAVFTIVKKICIIK